MHRIDSTYREVNKFGAGKDGFTNGVPSQTEATATTDDWLDGVQEEIITPIEGLDIPLVKGTRDQLSTSIKKLEEMDSVSNWKHITVPKFEDLLSIAHDGEFVYIAVGRLTAASDSFIMRSEDGGVTWAERASAIVRDLRGIAYDGSGLFCTVGRSDGADASIWTSTTGTSWTQRGVGTLLDADLNGIAYNGSTLWCAVGGPDGADSYITTSPGATTWTTRGAGTLENLSLFAIAHNQTNLWCAVGGTTADPYIVTSPDGVTWTRRETATFPLGTALRAVTYDSLLGLWIAGGDNQAASSDPFLITSPDAITWTERTITGAANILGLATNARGLIIAVGDDTSSGAWIRTSTDGINWVKQISAPDEGVGLNGVAHGDRIWLICGDNNGAESTFMHSKRVYF